MEAEKNLNITLSPKYTLYLLFSEPSWEEILLTPVFKIAVMCDTDKVLKVSCGGCNDRQLDKRVLGEQHK